MHRQPNASTPVSCHLNPPEPALHHCVALRNITNAFTQHLDKFEHVYTAQQTQPTGLNKATAENSKKADALIEIAVSNKKTNEQLSLSMTALIQQTQLLLGNQRL
jgi:hypothetical protein